MGSLRPSSLQSRGEDMSLGSLSLVGPTPGALCGWGMERPPTGVGMRGDSGPHPFAAFPGPLRGGGGRLSRGEVTFHLPCLFLEEKKSAGSAPASVSPLSPRLVILLYFSHSFCACASAPSPFSWAPFPGSLMSFVLGFVSSGRLK